MKIKFDIKYRGKIESGKYQVVLDDNTPVTIVKWDTKSPYPILAVIPTEIADFNGESSCIEERPYIYGENGICPLKPLSDVYRQLYIETGDDLLPHERMLCDLVNDHVYNHESITEEEVRYWIDENFFPVLTEDYMHKGDYFYYDGNYYAKLKNKMD